MADQVISPVMLWAHDQNNAQANREVKTYRNFTENIPTALTTAHFLETATALLCFSPKNITYKTVLDSRRKGRCCGSLGILRRWMEGWRGGRMEAWKDRRMDGWKESTLVRFSLSVCFVLFCILCFASFSFVSFVLFALFCFLFVCFDWFFVCLFWLVCFLLFALLCFACFVLFVFFWFGLFVLTLATSGSASMYGASTRGLALTLCQPLSKHGTVSHRGHSGRQKQWRRPAAPPPASDGLYHRHWELNCTLQSNADNIHMYTWWGIHSSIYLQGKQLNVEDLYDMLVDNNANSLCFITK